MIIPAGFGAILSLSFYRDRPPVPPASSGDIESVPFFKGLKQVRLEITLFVCRGKKKTEHLIPTSRFLLFSDGDECEFLGAAGCVGLWCRCFQCTAHHPSPVPLPQWIHECEWVQLLAQQLKLLLQISMSFFSCFVCHFKTLFSCPMCVCLFVCVCLLFTVFFRIPKPLVCLANLC